MAGLDLDHPPKGVVLLPREHVDQARLSPRDWIAAVRRPATRTLDRAVADYLAEARERDEA